MKSIWEDNNPDCQTHLYMRKMAATAPPPNEPGYPEPGRSSRLIIRVSHPTFLQLNRTNLNNATNYIKTHTALSEKETPGEGLSRIIAHASRTVEEDERGLERVKRGGGKPLLRHSRYDSPSIQDIRVFKTSEYSGHREARSGPVDGVQRGPDVLDP